MKSKTVKGTRDISGEDAIIREKVVSTLKKIYQKYGFSPLFTPIIEYTETLKAKSTDEILGLMYEFKDKAKRNLGLRYDLTIGLARFVATNQISLPFKRYQIERAYRYESPSPGRYREFWQADIDVVGVRSVKAEAECLACISEILKELKIKDYTIMVNSRILLDNIAEELGIKKEKSKVYQILDKLDKIGEKEVKIQLKKLIGIKTNKLFKIISENKQRTEDIKELITYSKKYGFNKKLKVNLSLVRGLGYYTGLIFEIIINGKNQSIAGGGRYDDIISKLGGQNTPATGISIGLDRITDIIKDQTKEESLTKIYLIPISKEQEDYSIELLNKLRDKGINSDIVLTKRSISKNIDFVNKTNIPYAAFIGEKEEKSGKLKLKNMKTGKEQVISLIQLIKMLK